MRSGWRRGERTMFDRRTFLRLAGYGGAGLVVSRSGVPVAAEEALDPTAVSQLEFDVVYRTELLDLPRDAEDIHVWMPVPTSDHAQQIRDLSVSCPLPYELKTGPLYGNRMIHVRSGPQPERFAIEARYRVERRRVGVSPGLIDATAAERYLRLTQRVRVTAEVEAFTAKAVGDAVRPAEVARRGYDAIIGHLSYDKEIPGCGTGDTAWIMKHRRGKCDDYHALFMAMMISRRIPVRWEQGFPLPYPSDEARTSGKLAGDCTGAHCWASFHDPEQGWVPVDVSEADKHPELADFFFGQLTPNRFKVSEGRAITLSPPQGGEVLSTFAFAYAEADGLPLIYGANYENLVQFTVTGLRTS